MNSRKLTVGFDIGSVSVNTIVVDQNSRIIEELPYVRHFGRTLQSCSRMLNQLEQKYSKEAIDRVVFTGTHGKSIAEATGTFFEIETTAQTKGLYAVAPEARSVISIGGHDSALLIVSPAENGFILEDFKLNEACAAGTGSFIDQQAERIFSDMPQFETLTNPQTRIDSILEHFILEGKQADCAANVACRCTVFTKSDMIHLQNKGVPVRQIIAGLHEGVAKNFKSTLVTNQALEQPIAFIGGYATNKLAKDSFEKILGASVVVPDHHTTIGALGVALTAIAGDHGKPVSADQIAELKNSDAFEAVRTSPLEIKLAPFADCGDKMPFPEGSAPVEAYLGFDIGSTTTKLVLIKKSGEILYKRYIPTEGQPVVAIKKALKNCIATIPIDRIKVLGVGTTGSGREVANLFVGADDVVNEVTAHAKGSTFYAPDVDTIFELGGQDAKYTSLKDGFVVDFRMNKVCAAGTGSFLEETANKLGIDICGEYEQLAMSAKAPYSLTERCTVYMESDLISYLQMGGSREDLLAGLSMAVVHNYLNRVVQDGKIGNKISFQGGPSLNKSVVAAFEAVVGKPIITLPHREVMGAVGAALHARDEIGIRTTAGEAFESRFRGWAIVDAPFSHVEEICERNPDCHNQCKLQVYQIGESEAIYGGDCGMYESRAKAAKRAPDFNRIRQQLFFKQIKDKYHVTGDEKFQRRPGRPIVGIPRSLSFFQVGILWTTLFDSLGFDVVITPETDDFIVDRGIEAMTCEACFPVKISHGHAQVLKDHCDYLFLPMMIEMETAGSKKSCYCPYLEANTYMLKAAVGLDSNRLIMPAVYLKEGITSITEEFSTEFARLGLPFELDRFKEAFNEALAAQGAFEQEIKKVGKAVLNNLGDKRAIVVVGRPYSAYDSRTNLDLFATFSRLGMLAIPQEFLEIGGMEIDQDYPNMYWGSGTKILKAAKFINSDRRLFGLYLTSFSCGPDSFILHFFNHEMNRTGRPYLELELDEHSAGAGVETRLLAFMDVIKNQREVLTIADKNVNIVQRQTPAPLAGRKIYIPSMAEGSACLAAAFKGVGCDATVMDTYTKEGIEFSKSHTSGKECYPFTVTTGDMFNLINNLKKNKVDVENEVAFFMPEAEGPCRFGQYNKLHRILLEQYGLGRVPILSPSSEDCYRFNGFFTNDQASAFRQLAWEAIVFGDLMEKSLWRVRPYEKVKGSTEKVFMDSMTRGIDAIKRGGGLRLVKAAKKAAEEFSRIDLKNERRPLIGIVGEIYLRTHSGSNQQLVKTLESMGCETHTSSIGEWIDYITHTTIEDADLAYRRNPGFSTISNKFKAWATAKYQTVVGKILGAPFRSLLKDRFDHPTPHILHEAEGLFSNHINGEAILSIGGALALQKDGFNGVVNVMPFTCMPSTIASSILKVQLRKKVPYVDMIYDGTILPNRETNLATFVFQAAQNLSKH